MEQNERLLQEWKNAQQSSDTLHRDYSIEGDSVLLTLFPPNHGLGFCARCAFTSDGVQEAISKLSQRQELQSLVNRLISQ